MKSEPITVNGETFNTKKALTEHVRAIRDKYQDYELLDRDDLAFMLDLLKRHSAAEQKVGCGIVSMHVETEWLWKKTRGFYLTRTDGSTTDFSFIECISNTPQCRRFAEACRAAVREDIISYKVKYFNGRCELTGRPISQDEAHVDHAAPNTFDQIVKDFVAENNLNANDPTLTTRTHDGDYGALFTDDAMRDKFRAYHNERAQLRIVAGDVNLRLPK